MCFEVLVTKLFILKEGFESLEATDALLKQSSSCKKDVMNLRIYHCKFGNFEIKIANQNVFK